MNNLPIFDFDWNKPVTLSFVYEPKEATLTKGKYPKHNLTVSIAGEKMKLFTTDKQQNEIINAGCVPGVDYVITKEPIPGSTNYNFWIYDATGKTKLNGVATSHRENTERVAQAMTSDDLPPLEEYLKDPQADQSINSQNQSAINANKNEVDKIEAGMCYKLACHKFPAGTDTTLIIKEAVALFHAYQNYVQQLMSE